MSAQQDHFSQSFALQFISLILFVLIFTIWSFLPGMVQNQKNAPDLQADRVIVERKTDLIAVYQAPLEKKFFTDDAFSLYEPAWEGIRQLLFQHDLSLRIKVKSFPEARALFERLIESEFPEESILVEADERIPVEEVMVVKGASVWQ